MPTYQELLLSSKWKEKRTAIIERDNKKCRNCQNKMLVENTDIALLDNEFFNTLNSRNRNIKIGDTIPNNTTIPFYFRNAIVDLITYPLIIYYLKGDENIPKILSIRSLIDSEIVNYINEPKSRLNAFLNDPNKNITDVDEYAKKITALERMPFQEVEISDSDYSIFKWVYVQDLNVHHTYYQEGLLPWEYPDNSLATYCQICHMELHATQTVPCKDKFGNDIEELTPCSRCGGAGEFPEFYHVEEGICFRCRGAKYDEFISK